MLFCYCSCILFNNVDLLNFLPSCSQVLDIQKLAVEMGLSCIKTFKLDVLKAVLRSNECNDMNVLSCSQEDDSDVTKQKSNLNLLHVEKIDSLSSEQHSADDVVKTSGR